MKEGVGDGYGGVGEGKGELAGSFLDALDVHGGAPPLDHDDHTHPMVARLQRSKVPTKYGKKLSPLFQHYREKLRARTSSSPTPTAGEFTSRKRRGSS